jgi:hypothetical protein
MAIPSAQTTSTFLLRGRTVLKVAGDNGSLEELLIYLIIK